MWVWYLTSKPWKYNNKYDNCMIFLFFLLLHLGCRVSSFRIFVAEVITTYGCSANFLKYFCLPLFTVRDICRAISEEANVNWNIWEILARVTNMQNYSLKTKGCLDKSVHVRSLYLETARVDVTTDDGSGGRESGREGGGFRCERAWRIPGGGQRGRASLSSACEATAGEPDARLWAAACGYLSQMPEQAKATATFHPVTGKMRE